MFNFLLKQRIRRSAEFDVVLQTGKRLSDACFTLCFKSTGRDFCRLGVMVGKKYCPLAVRRNRIKRLVRARFRLHQAQLPSVDIVFLLRSKTDSVTDQEQVTCIESLFTQLMAQSDQFDGSASN